MNTRKRYNQRTQQVRYSFLYRVLRFILFGFIIILAFPILLIPTYNIIAPPISTLMIWRLTEGEGIRQEWVSFEKMSPALPLAVLSSEDGRFCDHNGVDWQSVSLVLEHWRQGNASRGASTITMQLIKNLFLWPHRSYLRKGLEVPFALYADIIWSKKRVLEIYLNIVEWGPGIYGAEAAAQYYFNKSARRLNSREAALLATALPNPRKRDPARPRKLHRHLASIIQKRANGAEIYFKCVF